MAEETEKTPKAKRVIDVDSLELVVEDIDLSRGPSKLKGVKRGPSQDVVKFIDKCVEVYSKLNLGQGVPVLNTTLGSVSLKKFLKERIKETETDRLIFKDIKDPNDATKVIGTRFIKAPQKGAEAAKDTDAV